MLATGYTRMVYGDHGPYVEFDEKNLNLSEFPHVKKKSTSAYYDERFTEDRKIMLYEQKKVRQKGSEPTKKW